MNLEDYVEVLRGQAKDRSSYRVELDVRDHAPPQLLDRLAKLSRLGLLTGDVLLSIIAQAPIDPINLFGTLQQTTPGEWVFSSIDFGMVRVLARHNDRVVAAVRVDLMDSSVTTLVMNRAGSLVQFQRLEPGHPSSVLAEMQAACDAAVSAAGREMAS